MGKQEESGLSSTLNMSTLKCLQQGIPWKSSGSDSALSLLSAWAFDP